MADNVADFIAFTGCPADQASMFLEMAGGSVEAAVEIFFSSQDGGGAAPMQDVVPEAASMPPTSGGPAQPWWSVLWPAEEAPPEAWTAQRLDKGGGEGWKGGIPQPKNGPCGVIAVVHSLILSEQYPRSPTQVELSPEATAKAIHEILARCRPEASAPLRLARPKAKGDYRPSAEIDISEFADAAAAQAEVCARVEDFRGPGGIIDLVYSAVFTRGLDLVMKEALTDGGELPLVPRMFNCWLCSMELMSLLLRGCANGNVGAFCGDGSRNAAWDSFNTVGILSRKEREQGVPVAEALKSPKTPVWILHGGDHFTVAWSPSPPPADAGGRFTLYHWNGLPPGGPRLAELSVVNVKAAIAGAEEKPKHYHPEPGEMEEEVQADPEDKKAFPGQYRKWRFEIMLARHREDEQGEKRPTGVPSEPKFDQEDPRFQRPGPWRCRLCYEKRFVTMDFSLNPAECQTCPKCQKPGKECGWSLWVPFADLPPSRQGPVMDKYAKKIEPVLWTRWPAAEISDVAGGALPDC